MFEQWGVYVLTVPRKSAREVLKRCEVLTREVPSSQPCTIKTQLKLREVAALPSDTVRSHLPRAATSKPLLCVAFKMTCGRSRPLSVRTSLVRTSLLTPRVWTSREDLRGMVSYTLAQFSRWPCAGWVCTDRASHTKVLAHERSSSGVSEVLTRVRGPHHESGLPPVILKAYRLRWQPLVGAHTPCGSTA